MSEYPTIDTEAVVLERLSLGLQASLSKELLHGIEVHDSQLIARDMADSMAFQLKASVWSDPSISHSKTYESTYERHPTWKHALVASLPQGSLRRRWCCFFWNIPLGYAATRVTHSVNVHVPAVLPEVQRRFPPDLGRVMFPINIYPSIYEDNELSR